jgi:hypothetical protein
MFKIQYSQNYKLQSCTYILINLDVFHISFKYDSYMPNIVHASTEDTLEY